MDTLDSKAHDKDYLAWYRDKEKKMLHNLCLRCGLYFKDISGLCNNCKKENKRR